MTMVCYTSLFYKWISKIRTMNFKIKKDKKRDSSKNPKEAKKIW